MKNNFRTWTKMLAVIVGFSAVTASADQVVLKDGDRITGTITTLGDGKLTITTAALGDVKVDYAQVATYSTDHPVDIHLTDGTTLNKKIDADGAGLIDVEGGVLGVQKVSVTEVESINPPPDAWTGSIQAGALFIRGNTFSDSLNAGASVQRKTAIDRLAFNGSYFYGRTKDHTTGVATTSADNWTTETHYDYYFTKKFYGFLDLQIAKDRISDLDLRVIPSGGVGYMWVNKPDVTFSTEIGAAWVYEKYTNATPVREDASVRLAYHLTSKINDQVTFFHDLEYLPSIQRGSNYIINTDLGLHVMLTKHFFTEAKITWDYDSNPAVGALKNNAWYGINLGYTF